MLTLILYNKNISFSCGRVCIESRPSHGCEFCRCCRVCVHQEVPELEMGQELELLLDYQLYPVMLRQLVSAEIPWRKTAEVSHTSSCRGFLLLATTEGRSLARVAAAFVLRCLGGGLTASEEAWLLLRRLDCFWGGLTASEEAWLLLRRLDCFWHAIINQYKTCPLR